MSRQLYLKTNTCNLSNSTMTNNKHQSTDIYVDVPINVYPPSVNVALKCYIGSELQKKKKRCNKKFKKVYSNLVA